MSIKELKAKMSALKKEMRAMGKDAIVSEVKTFLEAHPTITAIAWAQYAPGFNDGDPCIFHVRDFNYTTNPDTKEMFSNFSTYGEGDAKDEFTAYGEDEALTKAVRDLESAISDDDIFEHAFGSDGKVMITRDGTVSTGYVGHD